MSEDHLSNETSVSAELTETGIKASAKSRTVSSMDRLLGGTIDAGSAWLEGVAMRRRAKNEGERQLIEATVKYGLDKMNIDDQFAQRTFEGHFAKIARHQLNKDAVVAEALDDLKQMPPSDQEAAHGPSTVSEGFMGPFERYAETASSEELRQRWGRILSAEIRRPGTFSSKVLRATDELDSSTAKLFENLMRYHSRGMLVNAIMPEIEYTDRLRLIEAGLLVDPGIGGQSLTFGEGDGWGVPFWGTQFGQITVCFAKSVALPVKGNDILKIRDQRPAFGVHILTETGRALSSILPSYEYKIGLEYARKLQTVVGANEVFLIVPAGDGKFGKSSVPPAP
ncbi:hypothetical protein AGRHK599_LOCUS1226 [Rhizobium rhizogenes]|uniref:DUF2806 domain-containing protein n=1 Tax=Rhizobium rhizogenes TaxID=359 RepID=A0AAN2A296_RHIRH|nr:MULTISPECIES: DUF2806 domain-containing protein [Rhizobium/Agrobacterium group]MCZ7443000.1 DUF2806 domain-containing protein [Rhizobium rhizogenes]NSZ78986.1 DUF2806 domain-containing protein [Agrobacterium tumefaciens]CAD0211201.1 hypothetical protein AGRHK599_LOCUS1226 [Rhizobium rhizogenes]